MRDRSPLLLVIVAIVGLLLGAADDAGKVTLRSASDEQKLEGRWVVVELYEVGKNVTDQRETMAFIFKGNAITIVDGKDEFKGTFKLDPPKKPKTIDIICKENAKMTLLAIYELDGDTLKLCWGEEDGRRPTEFSTDEGDGLAILKRKK